MDALDKVSVLHQWKKSYTHRNALNHEDNESVKVNSRADLIKTLVQNNEVSKHRQDFEDSKLGEEGYTKYMERVEANVGRYLPGFRHFENFNNYSFLFPDATIEQYRAEMNRQVELPEFITITR